MQLVAYGAQDVYLSGNPQITFFKVVSDVTQTSQLNQFNKPGMVLLILDVLLPATSTETVI